MNLKGQNVIVTGAGKGIGAALASQFEMRGAFVHRVVRREIDPSSAPGKGRVWLVDMEDPLQILDFQKRFEGEFGAPAVLVNNAGQLTGGLLEEQDPDAILRMLTVNLNHLVYLTRLFLPSMLRAKRGRIVNNASVSAIMYFPCASTYAASKAGVMAFTESLKQELRGTGVSTLLLLTPGVKTDMFDQIKNLYGAHLDVSFLDSVSTGSWAEKVCEAVESEIDTLVPGQWNRVGLSLARHLPGLFERMVAPKFRRNL